MLKWPDRVQTEAAARRWIRAESSRHPTLSRLGYFGSYARGDWGVGSDLDLVAVVRECAEPFHRRALDWDLSSLPVPADLLVYTIAEWDQLMAGGGLHARTLHRETIWIFP